MDSFKILISSSICWIFIKSKMLDYFENQSIENILEERAPSYEKNRDDLAFAKAKVRH